MRNPRALRPKYVVTKTAGLIQSRVLFRREVRRRLSQWQKVVTRNWTINGRFLAQPVAGVQRYAREVVAALDRLIAEEASFTRDLQLELVIPPQARADLPLTAIRSRKAGTIGGHPWEQLVLPSVARGGLLSLCNTGPVAARKQILCIHDLNTRTCPESYSRSFRLLYRFLVPASGRSATAVVTVSRHSAKELERHGVVPREKIAVAGNGHEHALTWSPRHTAETRAAAGPATVVVIGSSIPHKNVGLILGLAPQLAEAGIKVAVVGGADARVFRQAGASNTPNVIRLGRIPDNALAALLRDSLCLAFPSLTEGFGLPPLEAMALGCPVVASDRASLPEICGDAALYASPYDHDAWRDSFLRLARDPRLRRELVNRGRTRSALFSWRQTAEKYIELMARADGLDPTTHAAIRRENRADAL